MSGPSIHDLLGLPAEITRPNAYDIFALTLGESDIQVIRSAIEKRVLTLKEAKSSASPEVWTQAARAIQAAKNVLADPEQKAALDAQYGIIHDSQSARPEPAATSAADPLAALLPGTGASLPAPPAPASSQSAAPASSQSAAPASSQSADIPSPASPNADRTMPSASEAFSVSTVEPVAPAIASRRSSRRRRRSWGTFVLGSMLLLLLASIVGALAYAFLGGAKVQFVKNQDGFQLKTGGDSDSGSASAVRPSKPQTPANRGDAILSTPPPIRPNLPDVAPDMTGTMPGPVAAESPMMPETQPSPAPEPMPETQPASAPAPASPEPSPTPSPTPMSTPGPAPTPGPEVIAKADAAIAAARTAIVGGQWDVMKSLAETAESEAVTAEQKRDAKTLFQFADLATFYRGAVRRAMADLVAGNELKLTDSMTFLVQKSGGDRITLYRNKREFTYSFDDLPLVVSHALAPFQLDVSSPEGRAAKAVFQAISSKTTAGHRGESAEILRGLDSVQGADPQRLADFIESLE